MFTVDTCCTLAPYYEVQDGQLDAFKALALKLVAKTRTEPGCMHYAFSFSGNVSPRSIPLIGGSHALSARVRTRR